MVTVNYYLQPFDDRAQDFHSSLTMGSLDKNGSAVENIEGIARAEKMDAEKGGDGNNRTFGVEKVMNYISERDRFAQFNFRQLLFRIRAFGSSSRLPSWGRFASTRWCRPRPS